MNRCSACRRSAGRPGGTGQRQRLRIGTKPRRPFPVDAPELPALARGREIDALRQRAALPRIRGPVQVQRALDPAAMARHELLDRARARPARHHDLHQAAGQYAHREPPRATARAHAPGIVRRSRHGRAGRAGTNASRVLTGPPPAARHPAMARCASSSAAMFEPPIRCGRDAAGFERGDQVALRLLSGADDDRIDGEEPRLAALRNREPGIVDPLVSDTGEHAHAAALEREAMHPARRLAEVAAGRRRLALQQPDLARRRGFRRGARGPRGRSASCRCPTRA